MYKIVLGFFLVVCFGHTAIAQQVLPMKSGVSYTTIGSSTYGSDGSSSTTIGSTTYGSDGTSCTKIGSSTYCN